MPKPKTAAADPGAPNNPESRAASPPAPPAPGAEGRTVRDLQERKNQLAGEIRSLADKQASWTDDDRAAWQRLNGDYDAAARSIDEALQRASESEAVQRRLAEIEAANRQASGDRRIGLDDTERRRQNPEEQLRASEEDRAKAIACWLRANNDIPVRRDEVEAFQRVTGKTSLKRGYSFVRQARYSTERLGWCSGGQPMLRHYDVPAAEGRAMSLTAAAGGYTVPQGFMNELERKTLAYASVRQVCRIVRTDQGNSIPWPTVDDTSNTGELLAEAGSIGSSVDPTFAVVTLLAYKYSSKPILVSAELLMDSAFNLAMEIASLLGERLGRITGTHFTTGDNSSKPQGIVTAASAGVTAASATAIAADEVIGLAHALDPSYRMGATGYMMHDNIVLYLRKLKDATGAYLWQNSLQAGTPDRLNGYPVVVNQGMQSSVATGTVTVIFGDFSKYIVRDAGPTRLFRLEELYRANDQTGFVAFERHDGRAIQTAAIKKLTQA